VRRVVMPRFSFLDRQRSRSAKNADFFLDRHSSSLRGIAPKEPRGICLAIGCGLMTKPDWRVSPPQGSLLTGCRRLPPGDGAGAVPRFRVVGDTGEQTAQLERSG
jgi:hypothetical protein